MIVKPASMKSPLNLELSENENKITIDKIKGSYYSIFHYVSHVKHGLHTGTVTPPQSKRLLAQKCAAMRQVDSWFYIVQKWLSMFNWKYYNVKDSEDP